MDAARRATARGALQGRVPSTALRTSCFAPLTERDKDVAAPSARDDALLRYEATQSISTRAPCGKRGDGDGRARRRRAPK